MKATKWDVHAKPARQHRWSEDSLRQRLGSEGGRSGETHGYPRKSRLSTEWFLQRLTNVQHSTQPHMVSRLSRAVIRNT